MLNIVWFRTDLRLDHNHLLQRISDLKGKCIPLFILDLDGIKSSRFMNSKRLSCLIESLLDLNAQLQKLNSKLLILNGKPEDTFTNISTNHGIRLIISKHYSQRAFKRDESIKSIITKSGGVFEEIKNDVIYDNDDQILTKKGEPVKVFTFFKSQWLKRLKDDNFSPLVFQYNVDDLFYQVEEFDDLLKLQDLEVLQIENLKSLICDTGEFHGGSTNAQELWANFLNNKILNYNNDRDYLSLDGTSKLSLHLKWGSISPHQIVKECIKLLGNEFYKFRDFKGTEKESVETFLSEIIWREFYRYILAIFPHVETDNFNEKFNLINWENKDEKFDAWCSGKTGYPIVDACIRQMNETGWMHNRGRMIVASFLCKDLHIDWRKGEEYFHRKLIDYDQAANNGGWQWTAGTGTDASPYFRIFNPTEQAKKFDPEGLFIRKYLPELKNLPNKFIFEPSLMHESEQSIYGVILGKDYPYPIVDHKEARKKTLELYKV
jgi:deoxyribodipyrimidine photo-lyase